MKPLIIDNFIDQQSFQNLKNIMLGDNFCWNYNQAIDYADDKDKFQFTHSFYKDSGPSSFFYDTITPVLRRIKYKELFRIKANLLTRTSKIEPNTFHTDIQGNWGVIPYITSIFYLNTNDGYTEFEDGTKIESIENRWVSFPEDTKHRGASCTNERVRVVINFNYLT